MLGDRSPLLIAAAALILLPFVLVGLGLAVTSATEVVIFAMACMALNILVGYTGLVSFGHGAWFGLGAYIAALLQREVIPGSILLPILVALIAVAVLAVSFGYLILRRRGVYFSLLTMALSAMMYVVAFRWTSVTGGENGLGGIVRPDIAGIRLETNTAFYGLVGLIAFLTIYLLWRFHRSPVGQVLIAIRENEQRAQFIGYPTNRYKLVAFTLHGGDRRYALVPRPGVRRAFLRRLQGLPVWAHRQLVALVWSPVRRLCPILTHRTGRRRRSPPCPLPPKRHRNRCDVRQEDRRGTVARVPEA